MPQGWALENMADKGTWKNPTTVIIICPFSIKAIIPASYTGDIGSIPIGGSKSAKNLLR